MNTIIMMKYLQWFNLQMINWKILFLMNNDFVHEYAAKLLKKCFFLYKIFFNFLIRTLSRISKLFTDNTDFDSWLM